MSNYHNHHSQSYETIQSHFIQDAPGQHSSDPGHRYIYPTYAAPATDYHPIAQAHALAFNRDSLVPAPPAQTPLADYNVHTAAADVGGDSAGGPCVVATYSAVPSRQDPVAELAHQNTADLYPGLSGPPMAPIPSMTPGIPSMAPPPPPIRPPTTSSARSTTGLVRHRSRAARMVSRTREYVSSTRERTNEAEVHWSEVDEEGTWVLMFVPAQRSHAF